MPEPPRTVVASVKPKGHVDEAWRRLRTVVLARPRTAVQEEADTYLHVVVRSSVFHFPDDLELILDAAARRVHVRSAARYGSSDFGVNRRRVEQLRAALHAEGTVQ
jgi:uncharacterized protein (DUF1499 family)